MTPSDARRLRLTGVQLKTLFLKKYTDNGLLKDGVNLVQPFPQANRKTIIVKSGKNWQFRLGKIEEVESLIHRYLDDGKVVLFKPYAYNTLSQSLLTDLFFYKYAFHSRLFIVRNGLMWQVYNSRDIVSLIRDHCTIRILSSGRIKFDFHNLGKTTKGIMTIEYRPEAHKKSWVFGAHGGGSGEKLRKILEDNLLYTELSL